MTKLQSLISVIGKKPYWVLITFGVVFFFLYSWLYTATPSIYNSPDETATAVFVQTFIETGGLSIPFEQNPNNLIRPRSVNIYGANFVPGGFIGLPLLLSAFGQIFGPTLVEFIPSLFAVIAVICSYSIFKRAFGKNLALLSAIAFFFLPAWWHFTAKGFLPNSLFVSFLLIAMAACLYAHTFQKRLKQIAVLMLSGLFLGGALMIRPNELWWVVVSLLVLCFFYRKQIAWKSLFFALLPIIGLGVLYLSFQSSLYGDALATGYDRLQAGGEEAVISRIIGTIFPFGIDFIQTGKNLFAFLFQLFWWHSILVVIGLVLWFKTPLKSGEQKIYTGLFFLISLYLFFYYGAWSIADDLDANRISIGVSYIRYWLPYFILSLPFFVKGIEGLSSKIKSSKLVFSFSFILLLIGQSVFVLHGKDGLQQIQQTVVNYKEIQNKILSATESNAVIIGERTDKLIWPHRQVIHYQDQDFSFLELLSDTADLYPVYWMTLLPYDHVTVWEETVFAEEGFELLPIEFSVHGYSLYKINYVNNS